MKNLYFIGIVPEKNICEKIKQLKLLAQDKFNCSWALRSTAHITLVPPFHLELSSENQLSNELTNFNYDKFPISIDGFDHFSDRVIFLKVDNHKKIFTLKQTLDAQLDSFDIKSRTKNFHPHITIAFKDLNNEIFNVAFSYFNKLNLYEISKNWKICLFKNDKSGWKILNSNKK